MHFNQSASKVGGAVPNVGQSGSAGFFLLACILDAHGFSSTAVTN